MLWIRLWDKNYTLKIYVLVLIGNLSSVSIADLSTELCVAEPVMWNSVCPTWTMFIGGKKIYVLCRKDISNTDIFPVLAGGWGRNQREKKKSNIGRTSAFMISILVCCPPIHFRGGTFPLLSQRVIYWEMAFCKLNDTLTTGEFSRQKFFLFSCIIFHTCGFLIP